MKPVAIVGPRRPSTSRRMLANGALIALVAISALALSRPILAQGQSTNGAPAGTVPSPLTGRERWRFYLDETYLSPMPYAVTLGGGAFRQAFGYPREWGGGFKGYGLRSASQYGLVVTQNSIHDGGEALFRYEPRYIPCPCTGIWRRAGYALEMSFLTYDEHGHKRLDLPQLAGAYGSGMISALCYPRHFSPLVQGVQAGHAQLGFVIGMHLYQEFSPPLQHHWPLNKMAGHRLD